MGSKPGARLLAATGVAALLLLLAARQAAAAMPWWAPVAFQGTSLTAVAASGKTLLVRTASGQTLVSSDSGVHFTDVAGNPPVSPQASVTSGPFTWRIDGSGTVLRAKESAGTFMPDPGSPHLGAGAHLLAAPAAVPGVVVAVATDGTVWRRALDGDWKRSLLLLPQSLVQGTPRVTAVAAFTQPLSDTVYLATDGYAVLDSTNGGDDWIRAGPGLPDSVTALATDSSSKSLYAATPDGLWVHVLQALPQPPAYHDAALLGRWIGIGATTIVSSMLAVLALLRLMQRRGSRTSA